jgi:RHS repeat-associated protein
LGDSTGTLQTQYTYEPFGYATTSGAASTSSYKYTGREDDGTGLYYYRARYYHPRLQRFISEDPIGLIGGINRYAYVGNLPTMRTDPTGLLWWGGHFSITLSAALQAGFSYSDALNLALKVMLVDFRKHSQDATPDATKLHAMRAPGQSCKDAEQAINDLINGNDPQFGLDLPFRIHAAQDAAAPWHYLELWDGQYHLDHVWNDVFYGDAVGQAATNATLNLLRGMP